MSVEVKMKDKLAAIESAVKIVGYILIIFVLVRVVFMPELSQKIKDTLANQDFKKIEIPNILKLELSDRLNTPERTSSKNPSDIKVTRNTKSVAEQLETLNRTTLNQPSPQSTSTVTPSKAPTYWVYLGTRTASRWKNGIFKIDNVPVPNQTIEAATDVFKRSDVARNENGVWKFGEIEGVLKQGQQVRVKRIEKVADEEGVGYWWAEVESIQST